MFRGLLFLLCIHQIICFINIPDVPCPDIFQYIYDGRDWLAHVSVPTPTVQRITLSVNFTVRDIHLSNYGSLKLYNKNKVLDDIKNNRPLKYEITLPKLRNLPQVTKIIYNGNEICSGPGLDPPNTKYWLTHILNVYASSLAPNHKPSNTISQTPATVKPYQVLINNDLECGSIRNKRSVEDPDVIPFIYNGTVIPRNSHPWLAALYDNDKGALSFFCGGILISVKHVISAAHCTINKQNFQVKLGAHNTNEAFEQGSILINTKFVTNHPEYSQETAHADISIIHLLYPVEFTQTIKPICLWDTDPDFSNIIGEKGTIMGWGLTEFGSTSTPLQTDVTIVSQRQCQSVKILQKIISDRTFCAGTKGTGPCLGDSGGGLYLKRNGKWYLRGIISTSVANRWLQICDVNTYAVYVDTTEYLKWIKDNTK